MFSLVKVSTGTMTAGPIMVPIKMLCYQLGMMKWGSRARAKGLLPILSTSRSASYSPPSLQRAVDHLMNPIANVFTMPTATKCKPPIEGREIGLQTEACL